MSTVQTKKGGRVFRPIGESGVELELLTQGKSQFVVSPLVFLT